MSMIGALEIFLVNHNVVLSILIDILGIIISLFGVYFGRKAYRVAKEIYEKGINLNKEKVLRQISLEFVTGFFIPLSKFKTATRSILVNACDDQRVLHVRDLIKDNQFFVLFPYFDAHKGDVWDSLSICEDMEQAKAFNTMMDFVDKARSFDRAISDLYDRLNTYLNPDKKGEDKSRAISTLKDFFDMDQSVNQETLNKGMRMIDELLQYEDKLPKELSISQMKQKLFRG